MFNIRRDLLRKLNSFYKDNRNHPIFRPLADTGMHMPLGSLDRRQRTWKKTIGLLSEQVINRPLSREDCWFVDPGHSTNGYVQVKLKGSTNKQQLHRLLYLVLHPEDYERLQGSDQVAHRCGRGRSGRTNRHCCVNPYHLTLTSHVNNVDHNKCQNGDATYCTHNPKCIWTDADGFYIRKRNEIKNASLQRTVSLL